MCLVTAFLTVLCPLAVAAPKMLSVLPQPAPGAAPITVETRLIRSFDGFDASRRQFGKLVWIGGLELNSETAQFGGFSGLHFVDEQRFVAVGDQGSVFAGRLVIEDGRPAGIEDATLGFLPGLEGRQPGWQRDAEGLDVAGDLAYVSFEGDTRVMLYGLDGAKVKPIRGRLDLPKSVLRANRGNKGLEAVAVAPMGSPHAGAVILMSESDKGGALQGWFHANRRTDAFTLPQVDGLLVTDAAFTATGDLLILERKFSFLGGLVIQIRRVKSADLTAGPVVKIETLFRGNLLDELDNMEGMAIQNLADGSSLISLISDDNFNSFQRTLLLQFVLPAGA